MPLGRAASYKPAQRASGGTQNTFTARYSSASSGSAPSDSSATSRAWRYSNASEMYFKEDQPQHEMAAGYRTTAGSVVESRIPGFLLIFNDVQHLGI